MREFRMLGYGGAPGGRPPGATRLRNLRNLFGRSDTRSGEVSGQPSCELVRARCGGASQFSGSLAGDSQREAGLTERLAKVARDKYHETPGGDDVGGTTWALDGVGRDARLLGYDGDDGFDRTRPGTAARRDRVLHSPSRQGRIPHLDSHAESFA